MQRTVIYSMNTHYPTFEQTRPDCQDHDTISLQCLLHILQSNGYKAHQNSLLYVSVRFFGA